MFLIVTKKRGCISTLRLLEAHEPNFMITGLTQIKL